MICFVPIVLVLLWIWLRFITRYPERTVRDVYPFFQRVEDEILVGSFHPHPEEEFRASHSNDEFKLWQGKRIHLAIYLCLHISANSRLLQRWAIHERKLSRQSPSREIREGLRAFQLAAMHSRTAAFAVRFRLRLRLIRMVMLPFLPVPSFRTLAEHSNDLIEFYRTAEVLAESFSRMYDKEIHENMLAVLGTVDLELDGLES